MKRGPSRSRGILTGMGEDYEDECMADEEGEYEQDQWEDEEGEEEMEAADGEFVSDDNSDAPPKVIPITSTINNERQEEDEVSDINLDDYESSSEYDSDDLDPATTENPHGFVFGNMLETYSKSRADRIEEMRELKD